MHNIFFIRRRCGEKTRQSNHYKHLVYNDRHTCFRNWNAYF